MPTTMGIWMLVVESFPTIRASGEAWSTTRMRLTLDQALERTEADLLFDQQKSFLVHLDPTDSGRMLVDHQDQTDMAVATKIDHNKLLKSVKICALQRPLILSRAWTGFTETVSKRCYKSNALWRNVRLLWH